MYKLSDPDIGQTNTEWLEGIRTSLKHQTLTLPTYSGETVRLLEKFECYNLPEPQREVGKVFESLAFQLAGWMEGGEMESGLRKLLEARNAMVEAASTLSEDDA
jgi:hypothetical protein